MGLYSPHLWSYGGVACIVAMCPFLISEQFSFLVTAFSVSRIFQGKPFNSFIFSSFHFPFTFDISDFHPFSPLSLCLISLSLLLLLRISLHLIWFSSLFSGTFSYFYAFSLFGCSVFFSFTFLFSVLGLCNFAEWWIILNLGISLPPSPFFSLAWGGC